MCQWLLVLQTTSRTELQWLHCKSQTIS
uniref:Uncharacterized protein n=1 Tax=Anguilla anguilla TaxID=7936 RepID=A0A0E9TA49_ANGAN